MFTDDLAIQGTKPLNDSFVNDLSSPRYSTWSKLPNVSGLPMLFKRCQTITFNCLIWHRLLKFTLKQKILFILSIDKLLHPSYSVRWNYYLYIQPQTSTMQPLKYENGLVISSHTLLLMWLLIHVRIKVNPCKHVSKRGPGGGYCQDKPQITHYIDLDNSVSQPDYISQRSCILEMRPVMPSIQLFVQQLVQASNQKNQISTLLTLCVGNQSVTEGFPTQRASNVETHPCHDVIIW